MLCEGEVARKERARDSETWKTCAVVASVEQGAEG